MSTRKPRGTGRGTPSKSRGSGKGAASKSGGSGKSAAGKSGGTGKPVTRKPRAASKSAASTPRVAPPSSVKQAVRKPPVPAPESARASSLPPLVPAPTGAPLAFSSRVSEMPPPAQVRSAEAAALRGITTRRAFESVMAPEPAPPPPSGAEPYRASRGVRGGGELQGSGDRERQRLAALRKETAKRPAVSVRPDYFGTAEHRATAEQLARMLAGEPVFARHATKQTHVLLRVAQPHPVPGALLERDALSVASADPTWREPFQARLEDLMARYRPLTDLEIRPGLTLTYGEVVALAGDYYGTPEELAAELTPTVAEAIRGVTPQDEGTFLLNTHRGWFDYVSLANENQDHFAPRNWARYARHHAEALRLALDRNLDAALVRNAFADHFLSDAFASGHLRVPRDMLVGLTGALPTRMMHDEENVHGLWVQNASGFVWRCYGDDHLGTNPVHLTLTAHAVGLSLLRIFRAYRLEGEAADTLRAAVDEAPVLELTAGEMVDPRTLPDFLGDIAGLPGIREHLPVPLGSAEAPDTANVLANYPPQVGLDGRRRKATPDFEAYFRFE